MTSDDINESLKSAGVNVTARTVCNRLIAGGLRARIPRKKPYLNSRQRAARFQRITKSLRQNFGYVQTSTRRRKTQWFFNSTTKTKLCSSTAKRQGTFIARLLEPSGPPNNLTTCPSELTRHTRCSRSPWQTTNSPLDSWTACHGETTSSGSTTSRSK